MNVKTENLVTVKNYALSQSITTSYVYKLFKAKNIEPIVIDGVKFIDVKKYPTIKK